MPVLTNQYKVMAGYETTEDGLDVIKSKMTGIWRRRRAGRNSDDHWEHHPPEGLPDEMREMFEGWVRQLDDKERDRSLHNQLGLHLAKELQMWLGADGSVSYEAS